MDDSDIFVGMETQSEIFDAVLQARNTVSDALNSSRPWKSKGFELALIAVVMEPQMARGFPERFTVDRKERL